MQLSGTEIKTFCLITSFDLITLIPCENLQCKKFTETLIKLKKICKITNLSKKLKVGDSFKFSAQDSDLAQLC